MPSAGHLIPNQADCCLTNDRVPRGCHFEYVPACWDKYHYIPKLHLTVPCRRCKTPCPHNCIKVLHLPKHHTKPPPYKH